MSAKSKIILTFAFSAVCVVAPFCAVASANAQPPNPLASIGASVQGAFNSFEQQLSSLYAQLFPGSVTSTVTLQLGDKSVLVAVLQRTLITAGYLEPPATGVFDASTQAAVELFQKANNLPATGYIKLKSASIPATFKATAIPFVPITVGTTGGQTNNVQAYLIKNGSLKISSPTGYFGTLTQAAVKNFQASRNIPQTGVIDQATFAAMNGK